jgi:hypothetical protein
MTINLDFIFPLFVAIYLLYVGLTVIFGQPQNATVKAILATIAGVAGLLSILL